VAEKEKLMSKKETNLSARIAKKQRRKKRQPKRQLDCYGLDKDTKVGKISFVIPEWEGHF
jgi:hypothetical protein